MTFKVLLLRDCIKNGDRPNTTAIGRVRKNMTFKVLLLRDCIKNGDRPNTTPAGRYLRLQDSAFPNTFLRVFSFSMIMWCDPSAHCWC